MSDWERDRLREKQDRLLELCEGMNPHLRISFHCPGSPTLAELETYLYPEWEDVVDAQIRRLEADCE